MVEVMNVMMNSNRKSLVAILAVSLSMLSFTGEAFALKKTKATIGIHTVEITPSIRKAAAAHGSEQVLSLERVAESMGQQLIDRVHNTRKFSVVSRSDLSTILKDQDLQRFSSDPSDANIAQAFKIAGCKYALIVTIVDFQDLQEELRGEGGVVMATKRTVRLSSVLKIYNVTTGVLLESASFQLSNKDGKKKMFGADADGKRSDALLTDMAFTMAHQASNRVVDVIYPAKILKLTGKIVTINRGDGTGIAKGQTWNVFALGEELIDPDTGENLGAEEIGIGKVRITSVRPKTAQGQVIDDYGIDKGHILRRTEDGEGHDG